MAFTHFATWMVAASLVAATVYADCPAANYTISVEYTWQASDDTDANPYPSNAHFSPMVCALSKKATGFVVNSTASAGFKMLAEEGKDADLVKALNDSSDVDVVGTINATAEGTSTGKFSMVLSAKEGYSYIMCVAMIAPSPDWVIGIPSADLCTDDKLNSTMSADLVPYDAGTDSGTTYNATNSATSPQGKITMVNTTAVPIAKKFGKVTVTTKATAEEEEDDVCFPASATVETEDGNHVRMADLAVGTSVKVADGSYSPVFMFTHKLSAVRHTFVRLTTASGRVLSLTPSHYLYVDGELRAASTVRTGSSVVTATGHADEVVAVETVSDTGLYNPQTLHGDIVVNGVVASTYTTSVEPTAAHSLLAPVRALYKAGLGGVFAQLFHNGASTLASAAPSGPSVIA